MENAGQLFKRFLCRKNCHRRDIQRCTGTISIASGASSDLKILECKLPLATSILSLAAITLRLARHIYFQQQIPQAFSSSIFIVCCAKSLNSFAAGRYFRQGDRLRPEVLGEIDAI